MLNTVGLCVQEESLVYILSPVYAGCICNLINVPNYSIKKIDESG